MKNEISLEYQKALEIILTQGTLATRISNALQDDFSKEDLLKTYEKLANCLQNNELFTS